MESYIHPTKEEQRIMDQVTIPTGARHRVQKKFLTLIQSKKPIAFLLKLVAIPAVIALAIIVMPRDPETSPTSFIQQALAASRAQAERMSSDSVRHIIIVENKNLDDGLERDMWLSSDGKSWLETDTALTGSMRSVEGIQANIDGVQYVTPEYYAAEVEREAARAHNPPMPHVNKPLLEFTLPTGATAMSNYTRVTPTGWIACQTSTMGLQSTIDGQAVEQRVQELLGFGQQMNVTPNFTDAIAELASSLMVVDVGEKVVDGIGAAHIYRLSYRDTSMNDYTTVITRGTDFIFDVDTKELKEITHWYIDPEAYNEGRSTMFISKDEIVKLSSLPNNPLDPATNGLVAAPLYDDENIEQQQRIQITLPEDGCYTVNKEDLSTEKIAENEEDARAKGLLE